MGVVIQRYRQLAADPEWLADRLDVFGEWIMEVIKTTVIGFLNTWILFFKILQIVFTVLFFFFGAAAVMLRSGGSPTPPPRYPGGDW